MTGAEWVRWVFAGMFATLALYYLIRLFASDPATSTRGVDSTRGLMSLGMVAMLVPQLDPLPRQGWQVLFVIVAGYIAVRLVRRNLHIAPASVPDRGRRHELHLVVGAMAMVYMLAAMPAAHGMSHEPGSAAMASPDLALPALTWAFVAYFLVFVVRLGTRLAAPVTSLALTPPGGLVVSPHLLGSSEIVMGIGMSYMLIAMG